MIGIVGVPESPFPVVGLLPILVLVALMIAFWVATYKPKFPRFSLRTLFAVVVIVSIPCAWVGFSLNWIRQRRAFQTRPHVRTVVYGMAIAPLSLSILSEFGVDRILTHAKDESEARRLFPEAAVNPR